MKKYLSSVILFWSFVMVFAQSDDPIVMKINGKEVKKSEFEYIYNKNNNNAGVIDKGFLDEYINLFKNFKLKIAEAESRGMDTTAAFIQEFSEYRNQLAKSYLDKLVSVDEKLLLKAYDRAKECSELSAIFIAFPQIENGNYFKIIPADTVDAYRKAIEVRNQALKKGANFENLVKKYSSDERSKQDIHPGYLGWYSGMNLASSLEETIFHTASGQITMPIRTNQGYYVIKVHDKKPNPGEVHVAHILVAFPEETDSAYTLENIEKKIAEIYQKLVENVEFGDLAKEYSDDKISAINGGDLSWIRYGQMVTEFNDTIFSMTEIGSVSQPVKTKFGYHIIKLLEKRLETSFEELRPQLETKFDKTTDGFIALRQEGIDKLKLKNDYVLNKKVYQLLVDLANNVFPTDSLYISQLENNTETLFTLGGNTVKVSDFINYLNENPIAYSNLSSEAFIEKFNQFVYQILIDVEDKNLEDKYPDFRNLVKEYHDGILLFDVSSNEVWEKSSTDTEGLTRYFEKNKSKYAWDEPHWKGAVIFTKDSKSTKRIRKETSKMAYENAIQYLDNKYSSMVDSIPKIKIEEGLFTKGQNKYVDEIIFGGGKAELPQFYQDFFLLGKLLPQLPENYIDVKGLVISDYQDYLEQEWLKRLNEKFPVEIYRDVLLEGINER